MERASWIKCTKCGDHLPVDTYNVDVKCECGAIEVLGYGKRSYVRGKFDDWKLVVKKEEN